MPRYDAAGRGRITPDPVLTGIAIEFAAQQNYIADRLFPSVGVTEQHGRYELFGRSAFTRHYAGDRRAPGARANEVSGRKRYADTPFSVVEHALEELIPDEEKEMNPDEAGDALLDLGNALADPVPDDIQRIDGGHGRISIYWPRLAENG